MTPSWSTPARSSTSGVLRVFETAETILLPVNPEMSALKAMHGLLDYLNETGSIGGKSTFVLNNMFAREILKPRDIESALGSRITTDLPYDPFLYLKAVNEGVPIVLGRPALAGRRAARPAEHVRIRFRWLCRAGRLARQEAAAVRLRSPGVAARSLAGVAGRAVSGRRRAFARVLTLL